MIILIHGDNGSGKSTLAKNLATKLGYSHFSTGDFIRSFTEEHSQEKSVREFLQEKRKKNGVFDVDSLIDSKLKEALQNPNIVIDSRMGFYFAPLNALCIYCLLDSKTAATWILKGERRKAERFSSTRECESDLLKRKELDRETYLKKYHVDYTDLTHYDEIIYSSNYQDKKEEMLVEALRIVEKFKTKQP